MVHECKGCQSCIADMIDWDDPYLFDDAPSEESEVAELLPIGTVVRVSLYPVFSRQPFKGIIYGYNISKTKYKINPVLPTGEFAENTSIWAFPNEVQSLSDPL